MSHSNSDTHTSTPDFRAAEAHIARRGGRFTAIRRSIYQSLLDSDRPLGAYELLATIGTVGAQRPPTVYRALDWLIEQGVAAKLASSSKYVAIPPGSDAEALAFLICDTCGSTTAIPAAAPAAELASRAHAAGFTRVSPVIELVGQCGHHAEAGAAA